jgi:erythritol kinase
MSTIGLDLGTSRVKAVRFDDHWQAVDSEAETTELLRTADGWCEQDMDDVWAAAIRVVRAIAERTPDTVELVALTAQGDGCWLVDTHGEPVRPAILWNDNRGGLTIDQWETDGTLERTFRINGCYGASGLAHAQLRWLTTYEPSTLTRAARLLSAGSWIYQQLTGRQVLDVSDAANPFLDARTRTYDEGLLDQFDLIDSRRLLPDLVAGPDRVAPLLSPAAAVLGLPAGTPIGLAPYDVPATAIGTGTTEVGSAFAVLGTTLCVGVVTDDPRLDRSPNGMTLPGVTPDRWLLAYATMTGTEVLDWTANVLGLPDVPAVLHLAGTAAPDSGAPLMLPYLSPAGERSPFRNSGIRGSLHGISLAHSRADIARAALDGLTLAVKDCLHAAGQTGTLALAGGGARSPLWCQSISDATNLPVTAPDTPEIGARGAVLTAAADLGAGSLPDLLGRAVRPGTTYHPRPPETQRLAAAYELLTINQRP